MKTPPPIRILLADDHHVVRFGLTSLLDFESDLEICALAEDGSQVVEAYRLHHPDVVLMDMRMPVIDGVEAVRLIRQQDPLARILLLSAFDTDQDIRRARQAGAAGYLVKNSPPEELIRAIHAIHRGETHFPAHIVPGN